MGDVAASGGYFISAPASIIFAQPTTITGSIGVIFAKFNIGPALEQVGCQMVEFTQSLLLRCSRNFHAWSPVLKTILATTEYAGATP